MRWQLIAIVVLSFLCTDLYAQDSREAEFEKLLKEGTVFYDATDYEQALDRYQKARAIYDHPRLRITIGKTYEKLNKCAAAKELYFGVANDADVPTFERDRAKARLAVIDGECTEGKTEVVKNGNGDSKPADPIEPKDGTSGEVATTVKPQKKSMILPIVGGALTAVGVGGLIFGIVKTLGERSEIDDAWSELATINGCQYDASKDSIFDCPQTGLEDSTAYQNLADEVRATNTANAIIFVASGVVTATGVALLIYHFVRPAPEAAASEFSITPVVSKTFTGATLDVRF